MCDDCAVYHYDAIEQQEFLYEEINELKAALAEVKGIFVSAERTGAIKDKPEGVRFIKISDTLASAIADKIGDLL